MTSNSDQAARFVTVTSAHGVTTITLDSPANRNALSIALMTQLLAALDEATADEACRVIQLDHTGPVFCSGADLKETLASTSGGVPVPVSMLGDVLLAVAQCPKPVLAVVRGPARAGGLGLIAAADLAICTDEATFAFSEVRLGVVPAVISATVLPRLTPRAAAELFLTGDVFTGRRAAEIGLVTASVPGAELDEAAERLRDSLRRGGPQALRATKELLRVDGLAERLAALTELSVAFFGSDEGREGVAAIREKRNPAWVSQGH
ncbi:methylglutaconyl-CoA hydratase [Allocatelliglobosispora scoriae]|uniref:Methylglutaconyl-CoA hydratase n=1 Tax=Allocatelliglobosispora scoriae TaxID=643052 RepID=A0A841BRW3_9ACTN|nr:enoyl-CoA hydratase-related protein [Allocatelliglobosispora scoriae]MBB5869939.1 methylglutaconyl-CoA hydratase [Allocatelliglobosispora scoriae]